MTRTRFSSPIPPRTGSSAMRRKNWSAGRPHCFSRIARRWNETRRAVLNGDVVRQPVEVIARRKDGSPTYLEVSLSRWASQSRVLITAILRDVNERRVAQEILRASEAQFRTLAQAMPNHVWTARPDGHLDWFNDRVYEYSGAKPGTLDGEGWSSLVHPDDLSTVTELWRAALAVRRAL